MDFILHVFGACSDSHSHLDFLDILMVGGSFSSIMIYVKMKVNGLFKKDK